MNTLYQLVCQNTLCNLFNKHKGGETIRKQAITYRKLIPLLLITLTVLFCASTVSAAEEAIFVNGSSGLDTNDGYSWTSPKLTIQNATGTVSSNGVVTIADGTYSGTGNTNITINQNMTIQGLSQNGTIINGTDTNWIFNIASGVNVTICNLTFTNGIAFNGGAILNYGILSISNCTFTENTATHWGGAIYSDSYQSIMSLTDCTFTKNNALDSGGAIAYLNICNVTNCTFMYNSVTGAKSWCAGAIGAFSLSNSTVTGCTFIGNSVDPISTSFGGGAIYVFNAALTANYNRFYNNSARLGSAFAYNVGINDGVINAENNWWGSNVDPTTVTNLIHGPVDANPWVILTVNATPSIINNGETSAITADLNHINGGGDLVGGHIPDGRVTLDIPWGSLTNSGTSHSLSANTVAGVLSAIFYATEGALPLLNPVRVSATADGYTTSDSESAYISINPAAYLNLSQTVNVTNANVGDIIRYNITITNNGPDNVTVITLKDLLPVGSEFVSASPAQDIVGNPTPSSVELTWNNIIASLGLSQLQPSMSVSILVNARILASAAGTTLSNNANITYNVYPYFNESTANVYVNQATVELNKTANNTRPNVGETVLFTIVAKNNGPNTANNLIVTDTLPAGLDFVSCTGGGVWDPVTRTVTWPAATVANNGNITYYLTALVNSTSLAGTNITNVVNETHAEYPNNSTTNCTIYVPKADLYIQITSDKNNPNMGEIVLYTIVAKNNGPNTANNLIVTDTLPAGLDFVNCTGSGVWDPVTRTVTWPAVLVANGGNVTYYITALVNSTSLAGTNITNMVNETHAEYPNNSTTNCTIYVPKADLYIQITSDKNSPTVGETFTLRYKLGNNGPDDATNVTITIPLPEGFVISKIEGDGNWTVTGNTINWTMNNVTVGDPNLYISGWTTGPGNYLFTALIASDTFSINSRGVNPLTLNAQPTVNAATTTTSGNTIGMQGTGAPIVPLALAVLSILGGLAATRKKQ